MGIQEILTNKQKLTAFIKTTVLKTYSLKIWDRGLLHLKIIISSSGITQRNYSNPMSVRGKNHTAFKEQGKGNRE